MTKPASTATTKPLVLVLGMGIRNTRLRRLNAEIGVFNRRALRLTLAEIDTMVLNGLQIGQTMSTILDRLLATITKPPTEHFDVHRITHVLCRREDFDQNRSGIDLELLAELQERAGRDILLVILEKDQTVTFLNL